MQDVIAALQRTGLEFRGYLEPERAAVVDPDHAVRVNFETYLFSDTDHRDEFAADIVRYCGLLTDPIDLRRFHSTPDSPRAEHAGVTYYFQEQSHKDVFLSDPEAHRLPGYTM